MSDLPVDLVSGQSGHIAWHESIHQRHNAAALLTPEEFGAAGNGVTDDTAAFQVFLDALAATGGRGLLSAKDYRITSTLVINGNMTVEGVGSWGSYGAKVVGQNGTGPGIPWSAPYLTGSVLVWDSSDGSSMFTLGAEAVSLRMMGFGVRCASLWSTTSGHIFDMTPPGAGSGNGIVASKFSDMWVFGHGGNHYGWHVTNGFNNTYENVRSAGGGGMKLKDTGNGWNYGNSVVYNPMFKMICGGSAHIMHIAGPGSGTQYSLIHPQLIAMNIERYGFTGTSPSDPQKILVVDDGAALGLSILAPDFEQAGVSLGYTLPEIPSGNNWGQFFDPGGYDNTLSVGQAHSVLAWGSSRGGRVTRPINATFTATSTATISATSLTRTWLCDTTTAGFTLTLPPAVVGGEFVVKNVGPNTLTLSATGAETIDGSASLSLAQNQGVTVLCSTTGKWYVTTRA